VGNGGNNRCDASETDGALSLPGIREQRTAASDLWLGVNSTNRCLPTPADPQEPGQAKYPLWSSALPPPALAMLAAQSGVHGINPRKAAGGAVWGRRKHWRWAVKNHLGPARYTSWRRCLR